MVEPIFSQMQLVGVFMLILLLGVFLLYLRNPDYNSVYRKVVIAISSIMMVIFSFLGSVTLCKVFDYCGGLEKGEDRVLQLGLTILYYIMAGYTFVIINYFSQDSCSYDPNSPYRWTILGLTIGALVINLVLVLVHFIGTGKKKSARGMSGVQLVAPAR